MKTEILCGKTGQYRAEVSRNHALYVAERFPDVPEVGTTNRYRFFSARVGSTGADSGTVNMNVDGSGTAQEFYIGSHNDYDIHIMTIVIIIADTNVAHNSFADVAALTTGWDLKVIESGDSTFIIQKAKTGGQVIAQAGGREGFGDGNASWELTQWTGTEDAQLVMMPLFQYVPGGLRIGRGTKDKIVSVVNDDLQGLTEFYVRCLGYKHYD